MRYFLVPPLWLKPPGAEVFLEGPFAAAAADVAPNLYANHRVLFLLHIAGGVAAMLLGLPQFLGRFRNARPRFHRAFGSVYVAAVALGGITGFPLSFFILEGVAPELRTEVYPAVAAFASLSIVWPCVSAFALQRARQRRWSEHRAWMIRSYSLTFAAVTVRLVSPLFLLFSSDAVFVVTGSLWTWPLNLVVAEWLIRRRREAALAPTYAAPANS